MLLACHACCITDPQHLRAFPALFSLQNVKPEMLFPVERTAGHLLDIIDSATMKDNGRYVAWDGKDIVW